MKQAVRKGITLLLSLCMAMCFATVAMAEVQGTEFVAWIGEQGYTTLTEAVNKANDGDTIKLAAGTHVLYNQGVNKNQIEGKTLTFQGESEDNTTLLIGTPYNNSNGESNGDYSLEGTKSITFKHLTLQAGARMSQKGNVYTYAGENVTRNYMVFILLPLFSFDPFVFKGLSLIQMVEPIGE